VPRLILNADDFGLTQGVNQSIVELNRAGALTSATLMATASHFSAAAAEAIDGFRRHPLPLGVGCHIVLVDGTPALPPAEIPALASASRRFRPTLGSFLFDLLRGSIPEAEIELEAIAQIRRLQAAGVRVTHLDTHKHTHMFARVLRPLLRAARICGVRAIRNPFEPAWSAAATPGAPPARRMQVQVLGMQRKGFLRRVGEAGLATTDGALGVLATGTLDHATLDQLLAKMPEGTWELVCHPAYYDRELDAVQTRLRESRATEHATLLQTIPAFVASHPNVELIHFGQLKPVR
jgi:chitin disaccharide deacetylase